MERPSYVYILASAPYGTLYTGVTSNIVKRIWQHKEDLASGFTKTYGVHRLVWYEIHNDILAAITREKQIKAWKRGWKIRMILETNPTWRDLYLDFAA
jgi:putative endonuclease